MIQPEKRTYHKTMVYRNPFVCKTPLLARALGLNEVSDIGMYAPGAACASLFLYKYFLKVLLYISRNTVRTGLLQKYFCAT